MIGVRSARQYKVMIGLAYRWFEPGRTHAPKGRGRNRRWLPRRTGHRPITDTELVSLCFPGREHRPGTVAFRKQIDHAKKWREPRDQQGPAGQATPTPRRPPARFCRYGTGRIPAPSIFWCAPCGRRPEERNHRKTGSGGTWPTPPKATEVDSGETQLRNKGYFGILGGP